MQFLLKYIVGALVISGYGVTQLLYAMTQNVEYAESLEAMRHRLEENREARRVGALLFQALRAQEVQQEQDIVRSRIDAAQSEQERLMWIQYLTTVHNGRSQETQRLARNGEFLLQQETILTQARADVLRTQANSAHEQALARINATEQRQARVDAARETTRLWIEALSRPENSKLAAGGICASALGIYAAKQVTSFIADIARHWYTSPTLAQETSLLSLKERLSRFIRGHKPEQLSIQDVILEPQLAKRIKHIAEAVRNSVKHNAYLRNILFYGPPGTGKTMLAKILAYTSGLEYIYFAASSLDQFELKEALIKLTELFEFAKRSPKKLMIIIDEAEVLFANRDSIRLSEKSRKLLTHILAYTGTENQNFMLVVLTNRPQDMDQAFIKRCSDRIKIDIPGAEQRFALLKQQVQKHIIDCAYKKSKKVRDQKPLIIENGALAEEHMREIATKLDGFVGRDINQLVLTIQACAYASQDACVTKKLVDEIVAIKQTEKYQEEARFA